MIYALILILTGDPSIIWARAVDNCIVVHGRELTSVNVNLSKPTATLDGVPLVHHPDITADGPGAYGECLIFLDSGSGVNLTLTREDGKSVSGKVQRTQYEAAKWKGGKLEVIEPIVWKGGTLEDVVLVGQGYDGPVLVIDATNPVRLHRVRIEAESVGIEIRNATECCFDKVEVTAETPIYAPPQHMARRNNWIQCRLTGTQPQRGHASNRGMLGEECLIAECQWSDSDRGIIAQQSGPPMYANLIYRCTQRNTGTTIGGSEGVLFEAYNGLPYAGSVKGTNLNITTPDEIDARAGLFAFDLATKRYARVVNAFRWGSKGGYSVTLDRDMGTSSGQWFVGNAAVDNSILHFGCSSGKLGLHLFGRSSGTVCRFWDSRQIHDVVVEEACPIQPARQMTGFAWGNVYDHLRTTGQTRGIHRCTKYFDGALPEQTQLPWLEYAE